MKTIRIEEKEERKLLKSRWAIVSSALAFICLSAGVFSPILGLIFIVIHSTMESDLAFGDIGTGLMIASIPLLLAGSHFLDVWDKYRKSSEYPDRKD